MTGTINRISNNFHAVYYAKKVVPVQSSSWSTFSWSVNASTSPFWILTGNFRGATGNTYFVPSQPLIDGQIYSISFRWDDTNLAALTWSNSGLSGSTKSASLELSLYLYTIN